MGDDDDEFGADAGLLAAMAAADPIRPAARPSVPQQHSSSALQPRIQQPTPQRLDKAPPAASLTSSSDGNKVVQPTPQVLANKQQQSAGGILVSPRQRGNPVISSFKSMPWEYSDIPADYVMGLTTCALFLSLKYHRLHPEYIYTRIRNLQGKYNLRVLLTLVDIPNHEDSLRELSKTSLVNNVTIILCWSAAEAARYIELYKSYENAGFAAIRGQVSSSYGDRLTDFVTVPRSLNKSDAVALVANFGSLRNAVNAEAEQLGMLSGWGGVKVKRWTKAMEEPFRVKKAARRGTARPSGSAAAVAAAATMGATDDNQAVPLSRVPLRDMPSMQQQAEDEDDATAALLPTASPTTSAVKAMMEPQGQQKQFRFMDTGESDDEEDHDPERPAAAHQTKPGSITQQKQGQKNNSQDRGEEALSGGVAAALAKLRQGGGS